MDCLCPAFPSKTLHRTLLVATCSRGRVWPCTGSQAWHSGHLQRIMEPCPPIIVVWAYLVTLWSQVGISRTTWLVIGGLCPPKGSLLFPYLLEYCSFKKNPCNLLDFFARSNNYSITQCTYHWLKVQWAYHKAHLGHVTAHARATLTQCQAAMQVGDW